MGHTLANATHSEDPRSNWTHTRPAASPLGWPHKNPRAHLCDHSNPGLDKERPPSFFFSRYQPVRDWNTGGSRCPLPGERNINLKTGLNFERRVITPHTWLTFPSQHFKPLNILWMRRKRVNDFLFFFCHAARKTPSLPRSPLQLPPHHTHAINQWRLPLSGSVFSVAQH